ncbi:MAG TPA: META domain-containing protein [Pricia antarctica]|uniref:META domain-containing protein n=2 Tax=root TaxID=1 RepID=A0A831QVN1_9FLAO|nr:META domain-containing protein [Pricia antarctica]
MICKRPQAIKLIRTKIQSIVFVLILSLVTSCGTQKNMVQNDQLYNATWQLEYISGPRIAFEGLFPDKKPEFKFDKGSNEVIGNSGCNGYSAPYTLNAKSISFGEPGPSTMMYCGQGEQQFRTMMKKINAYSFDADGKLNLMMNEVSMMRFKKVAN